MQRYILISLGRAVLTLLGVSVIVFMLARASGNALDVMLPDTATADDRAAVAAFWGLDKPLHEQYLIFLANAVRGDFGRSFKWPGESAMGLILQRLPATLQIAIPAMMLSVAVALPIGVISAVRKDTIYDTGGKLIALLGQSLPSFWIAIVLVWIFSVQLGLLPTSGMGTPQHLVMPVIVLSLFGLAAFVRLLRSSMLEVLHTEYVKLARLKGLNEMTVILKHALKNAAIPPLTFFGLVLVNLFTGSVVVETIFAWPGVGLLALEATNARDYQVVQAVTIWGATMFIFINLGVDLLYGWIDPRVRR
jgi:peptide/nickel transport system permease protein